MATKSPDAVSPVWKYVAVSAGSIIIATVTTLIADISGQDAAHAQYLTQKQISELVSVKISVESPYVKDRDNLFTQLKSLEEDVKENRAEQRALRQTIIDLRDAITDLRVGIAEWTKASKKKIPPKIPNNGKKL